jgi:hypothetical protein
MLLYISDHKTVEDLQDRFNNCFPYLKLEFYKDADDGKECTKSNIVKPYTLIGDIRKKPGPEILDIKSWDKTSKIKQELRNRYGLNVQIFRLHEDHWIPTSYSDELTLKQQCELARSCVPL